MELIVIIVVVLVLLHLAGGAHRHRRHYRRTGLHPSLRYTYGMGWWGSVRLPGGFRIGHHL